MPRLLLVDDNQSIHKIAETLLAATDIELVCASSGAEALEKVAGEGPFDVALLDTSMQGMDGWELLDRLRAGGPMALAPVAMMAGVLDVVDPAILHKAPIQGFLKKPVELRDLADRVRTLLSTPVEPPRPAPAPAPTAFETLPHLRVSDHLPKEEDDLLLLEPGDLLEEEPAPPEEAVPEAAVPEAAVAEEAVAEEAVAEEAVHEEAVAEQAAPGLQVESLELEELDLEGLKGLAAPEPMEEETPGRIPDEEVTGLVPDFAPEDALREDLMGVVTDELPDLGPGRPERETGNLPEPPLPPDWSDESETLLELAAATALSEGEAEERAFDAPPFPEPALAEAPDFTPDSFREEESTFRPTPAFLPLLPEDGAPGEEEALAVAEPEEAPVPVVLEEAPSALDLDEAPSALDLEEAPIAVVLDEPTVSDELDGLPGADEVLESAGRETIPPWASTVGLLPPAEESLPAAEALPEPPVDIPELDAHIFEPEALALEPLPIEAPYVSATASTGPSTAPGSDPLAALLEDPALLDRLAEAVVARLGDRILREVAWEVMPEVADRLGRN
jgi:CheY-like chemotaxis protein